MGTSNCWGCLESGVLSARALTSYVQAQECECFDANCCLRQKVKLTNIWFAAFWFVSYVLTQLREFYSSTGTLLYTLAGETETEHYRRRNTTRSGTWDLGVTLGNESLILMTSELRRQEDMHFSHAWVVSFVDDLLKICGTCEQWRSHQHGRFSEWSLVLLLAQTGIAGVHPILIDCADSMGSSLRNPVQIKYTVDMSKANASRHKTLLAAAHWSWPQWHSNHQPSLPWWY